MTLAAALYRLLMPPFCILCGAAGYGPDICVGCRRDLPVNRPSCRRCAVPLEPHAAEVCAGCDQADPPWRAAFAAFRYEFPVSALLVGLKFHGRLHHARLLGELLALEARRRHLRRGIAPPALLLPVPLHPARERRRGFNQAAEIARHAGRILGVRVDTRSCRRTRPTCEQTALPASKRRANVAGAFAVSPGLRGCKVTIVDDVMTTASTAAALTAELVATGVRSVDVWAVARARRPAPMR